MGIAGWRLLCVVSGMVQAQIVKGYLEAAGIEVILKYEAIGQIYAVTVDGLGEVALFVPEKDWEEAQRILPSL